MRALDLASSGLATLARLGAGGIVQHAGKRPGELLELYDFEACPFCRKVREALTTLDLDVRVFPCPKGGTRFRPEAARRGGKAQFPFLVDPNEGVEMYESAAILTYLYATYGDGAPARGGGLLTTLSASVASTLRGTKGTRARPSRPPAAPLELWGFEASPYCRLVREALCSLEISYVLHNMGRRSPKRPAFAARAGKTMVPYLSDPNTGQAMFESADIVRYLQATYGA